MLEVEALGFRCLCVCVCVCLCVCVWFSVLMLASVARMVMCSIAGGGGSSIAERRCSRPWQFHFAFVKALLSQRCRFVDDQGVH